jgi:predicted metal-dependent hydrolase
MQEREVPCPGSSDCEGELHPFAIKGLELFNQGEYWKAHEALEEAWREEKGQIRHLYRGILQVGVAYLHITHGNYEGAMKLYHRSKYWLDPFPDICRGVHVRQLQEDLEAAIGEVRRLGPAKLSQINPSLLKAAVYHREEGRSR